VRLPNESNRLAIVGATGSGKTQAALWHLSMQDFDRRPWLIYNFKTDKSIDGIPHAQPIALDEIPIRPGIYIAHPKPDEELEVADQMWAVWEKQNTGVYIDEGYMVGRQNPAFRALLTQGRSRQIPMITLSQRPVWLDPFILSESEYYQIFRLNHLRDRQKVEEFVPNHGDSKIHPVRRRLPEYHSWYYDVGLDKLTALKPVPEIGKIHQTFDRRLAPVRKTI
jgi:hypothetical protein